MNPLRIRCENYRSFHDLDLQLPTGTLAILGANGAGKSSIVNVLELALFGPPSRNLGDYLTDGAVGDLMVELELEHRGDLYRVRRSYSARGRGSAKVDFEYVMPLIPDPDEEYDEGVVPGSHWAPLTRETAAETQALIEQTLGLSRATFRASAFLAQGDGAAFTEASPRDRKAILAECVGLDQWDRLHARVKTDRAAAESEVSRGTLAIEQATEELTYRKDTITERDAADSARGLLAAKLDADLQNVHTWEERLSTAQVAREKRAAVEERCLAARAAVAAAESRETKLAVEREHDLLYALARRPMLAERAETQGAREAEHADLVKATHEYASAEREVAQAVAEHERLTIERTRLLDEANALDEKARADSAAAEQMLEADAPTCQTCGQELEGDARGRAVDALIEAAATGEARAVTLRSQAHDLEAFINEQKPIAGRALTPPDPERTATALAQLRAARDATTQLAALDVKAERLAVVDAALVTLRDERPALDTALAQATADLEALGAAPAIAAVQASLDEAKETTNRRRTELAQVDRQIARCDERLERYATLTAQIVERREGIAAAQAELDLCLTLEKAYGRDGIPALIVENAAIPQIEAEANRILQELGTDYRVELQTQRALKSGEGFKDTLDIVVWAGSAARPYETFSGGERTRLNLALRIALARLLAHRRGAEVRMLCIDEPEFLDEQGTAALATMLQGLAGDFDRILLVSHHPSLRDAFEQSLEVVKDGDRSRVVGADREPVSAFLRGEKAQAA